MTMRATIIWDRLDEFDDVGIERLEFLAIRLCSGEPVARPVDHGQLGSDEFDCIHHPDRIEPHVRIESVASRQGERVQLGTNLQDGHSIGSGRLGDIQQGLFEAQIR